MNRDYQLQFCKVCKHRGVDMNKGIICSLTNEIAMFKTVCVDFSINEDLEKSEKIKQKQKINSENIYKQKIRPIIVVFALFSIGFLMIKYPHLYDNIDISGRKVIYKFIVKYIWGYTVGIISIILGFGVMYNYYINNFKNRNND